MMTRRSALVLILVLAGTLAGGAQSVAPTDAAKSDYSQEAAVIEAMSTRITFENSGNFTREQTSRVRVQTDAGVKQWGLLSFAFQSATQTVEIDYVRVHKADGSTILTPADNVQDLDAEITRSAPFYSDLREKHVAVKGLGRGDTLEYAAHWLSTKPLIPGQFWFQFSFQNNGIVLDERLEVKVPGDRAVKVKGLEARQTVHTEAGLRIYTWTYSKRQSGHEPGDEQKKATDAARGRLPAPDVQMSSFQTWEEVGRWYWNLQKDRIEPTPAIRAKAAELTKGLADDDAKLRALYSFVSTQYRYIGIAFGIGRYQPHSADDVLSNNYGDCKDKHTLLASLLQASGIALYPALINSGWTLDPEVPSPAQFDHVIGYLPHGKDAIWLDSTAEVAPVGLLVPQLRDKQALVMSGDKSIQLLTTPADPPWPASQAFKVDGKLANDGSFEAKIEDTVRGESELPFRAAFRMVPQPQWKDLVQQVSYGLGFAGTVSEVNASAPEAIGEPFHFSYSYHRKDYPDWGNHQFSVPGLPFFMPIARDDAKYPIWLGSPLETVSDSRVELPKGYTAEAPANVDLKYDFAEYHASYSQDNGGLIAKRSLLTKLHEVPVDKLDDYRNFVEHLQDDVNQYVQTSSGSAPESPINKAAASMRKLPDSPLAEANRLEKDALDDLKKQNLEAAVALLRRAVAADPNFARAWVMLGVCLLAQQKADAGIAAFGKAMALAPREPEIAKALGMELMVNKMYEPAIPVWQDYVKAHPDDVDGYATLGGCFYRSNRYAEAAEAYESAVKLKSDRPNLQYALAFSYLKAGNKEKAAAAFTDLKKVDAEGAYFNNAAYQMANADFELPLALEYANKAVRAAEERSQTITLAGLKKEDLGKIVSLAADWDTLGWVHERMSNMELAEQYLQASWKLTQDGVVAGHLCHLYKRMHRRDPAIQMCRMAIFRMTMSNQQLAPEEFETEIAAAEENLKSLAGAAATSKGTWDASGLTVRERTFALPRFLSGTASAEFFVLLAADTKSKTFKVEDVKFISGSDKMKLQGEQLKRIDFKIPAPSGSVARFVRRGILGCYQYTGCSFVLLDPASVTSLE